MAPILRYTYLAFELVSLLDDEKSLAFEETVGHIDDGSLFFWLTSEFADDVDLSLYKDEDRRTVLSVFQDLASAVDARKKFGVEHNGLALLVSYCLEAIQINTATPTDE